MRTCFLILLLCQTAYAQIEIVTGGSVKSTNAVASHSLNTNPFVVHIRPLREPQHAGYLEDILCRMKADYLRKYPDNLVTCGHEASHRLGDELDAGMVETWAFYVAGTGQAHYFKVPPKVRMAHVRALIPRNRQCDIYRLYLTQNEEFPLVLFDELNAYTNASFVAKEYKDDFQLKYELQNGYKLHYFCGVLLSVIPRTYQDYERLVAFHRLQLSRLDSLKGE